MPKPRMKPLQLKYIFGLTFSPQFPQYDIYPRSMLTKTSFESDSYGEPPDEVQPLHFRCAVKWSTTSTTTIKDLKYLKYHHTNQEL